MLRIFRTCLFLLTPIAVWASAYGAEPTAKPTLVTELMTPMPDHPDVTYFDLVRQIVPDLVMDGAVAVSPEAPPIPAIISFAPPSGYKAVRITSLQTMPFKAEGKMLVAILVTLGESEDYGEPPSVLAIFDNATKPKLVDMVDVGMDRMTGFSEMLLDIGKDDQMLMTSSQHFNAGQAYDIRLLIFMRHGKLALVDYLSLFNDQVCAFKRTQTIALAAVKPAKAGPYNDIKVSITDARFAGYQDCSDYHQGQAYARTYSTLYQWNEATGYFVANSDAMDRLKDETSKRF